MIGLQYPEIKPLLLYNYLLVLNDNPSIRGEEPRWMIHSKVQSNPTVEMSMSENPNTKIRRSQGPGVGLMTYDYPA